MKLARVLSGQQLHPTSGGLTPLEPGSARAMLPALRAAFPREFAMD